MKIIDKNTTNNLNFLETEDNTGLGDNDLWINIQYNIINDEVNLEGESSSITKKELIRLKGLLENLVNGRIRRSQKVQFIKNHIEFELFPNKTMIQKLHIYSTKIHDYYTLNYEEQEIREFIKIIKDFLDK